MVMANLMKEALLEWWCLVRIYFEEDDRWWESTSKQFYAQIIV